MLSFYLLNAEIEMIIEEKYFANKYNDSRLLLEKVYGCPKVKKAEEKSLTSHRVRAEK